MKRPGNRVIPSMKAMLHEVFAAQVFESPDGAEVPRHRSQCHRSDSIRTRRVTPPYVRNRRTDETIVILDHLEPEEKRSQQEEKG